MNIIKTLQTQLSTGFFNLNIILLIEIVKST